MRPFRLHRPGSVGEASKLLAELGDEAALYCGGTELLQVMKMGLAEFSDLIDVKGIDELQGITRGEGGGVRIGAAVTHRDVEQSSVVAESMPALVELERHVANVRVRNTGSLGGNLCFAEPHSDPATLLIAARAELELATAERARRLPVAEFFLGPLMTMREPDEVLVAVHVPPQRPASALVHRKIKFFERPAATVSVRLEASNGHLSDAVVVIGSVGSVPALSKEATDRLAGTAIRDVPAQAREAAQVAAESCEVFADHSGSEAYKRHLVRVLVERAIADAVGMLDG